ncbi:hypothetical protein I204_02391 [Kwoniella mangroviensis CBS 8886]|nr:hypothetical protein I204_02391 [Kwoniella mangroviensis CBS 8886]
MSYLAQSPESQRQIKSFRLITADARQSKRDDANRLRTSSKKSEGLSVARKVATFVDDVVGQISPVNEQAIFLTHKGNYLWITRKSKGYANYDPVDKEEHLEITGLSVQPENIKQFIIDAHAMFFKKADNELLIFDVS